MKLQAIDVADFLQALYNTYNELATIEFSFDSAQPILYADEIHFSNVMDNLIENAIKYSEPPAQINVTIKDCMGQKIISVKDQGFGIAPFDKKRIFDKFFRANDKRVLKKEGFGLGLTYVKTIIEAHRGTITVESELNKGSVFTIKLPHK